MAGTAAVHSDWTGLVNSQALVVMFEYQVLFLESRISASLR